jgi:hypothetical protein
MNWRVNRIFFTTVPDRYAFVIPLGMVKGIDTDDAAGTE